MALPHTTFVVPRTRPEHIVRARQLARIDPHARLLLVSAPAGYGKSTLAAQWVAETCDCPAAWVQLAPEDNQVFAFWIAILSGLDKLLEGVGRRSLDALSGPVADLEAIVLGRASASSRCCACSAGRCRSRRSPRRCSSSTTRSRRTARRSTASSGSAGARKRSRGQASWACVRPAVPFSAAPT